VASGIVATHVQAVMIHESRPAFRHSKYVAQVLDCRHGNHTGYDNDGDYDDK
jgi:hypothetical protein